MAQQNVAPVHPAQPPKPTGTVTIAFGVVSLVGVVVFGGFAFISRDPYFFNLIFPVSVVGIIGALASARTRHRPVALACAVQAGSVLLWLAFWFPIPVLSDLMWSFKMATFYVLVTLTLVGAIGVIKAGRREKATSRGLAVYAAPPQPAGHTADGQPFYPIVGYASDGRAITADQAPGYRPPATGTNTKAIVAFILAFTFTILAIPFGHMARSEIRKTGEGGDRLALAALIIGYLNLAVLVCVSVAVAVTLAQG